MFKMVRGSNAEEMMRNGTIPTDISHVEGELEYLPEKCETLENPGDVFEHTWSGGGGFGDPLDRDPEKVFADVLNEAVSVDAARRIYGVIVNGALDREATERERESIRAERLS
jgi:N-methylhydantoinase B